ncbi:MAG: DUF4230 domain-containing protein, partial [Spirochaetales bacterium]|nr:DUF4230 domain-containing protein [Spirochaetales bacterium]
MKQKNLFRQLIPGLTLVLIFSLLISCTPKTTLSRPVIKNQIRAMLELPTIEYIYREVIYVGQEAKFLGIKHLDKRLLFSIDLIINAGIDLTKGIEIRNITNGGIQVILPEPEILLVDADEGSIHQFFVKEWGDKVSRLDYYDEIVKSKKDITEDAIERDILIKAKNNAEEIILKIFSVYGTTKVDFRWRNISAE